MQNTEINKVKFFAQYWGQKVFVNPILDSRPVNNTYLFGYDEPEDIEMEYLQLKDINSITDKEILAYKSFQEMNEMADAYFINSFREYLVINNLSAYFVDYFRSKGFAIEWMGLSVEKQIEYGWIKITQL